jgi:hypothetical protein
LDIFNITIFDAKGTTTIYENNNCKILDCFSENSGKSF